MTVLELAERMHAHICPCPRAFDPEGPDAYHFEGIVQAAELAIQLLVPDRGAA